MEQSEMYVGGLKFKKSKKSLDDTMADIKQSSSVTYNDEMYNLTFEDVSKKLDKINEEITILKKYSGKIIDKYKDLDCFKFDRELIKNNALNEQKVLKGLKYLLAIQLNDKENRQNGGGSINDVTEIYGGGKSSTVKQFIESMKKFTDGVSIFSDKHIRQFESEFAKFIKGEKTGNLSQQDKDISDIEKLFLSKFADWYMSNKAKYPISFQDSFNSVFTSVNTLKIIKKENTLITQLFTNLVELDKQSGYYTLKDEEIAETEYDKIKPDIDGLKSIIESTKSQIKVNNHNLSNQNSEVRVQAQTKLEELNGALKEKTDKFNSKKQKLEKLKSGVEKGLSSISSEYKKALEKIKEKYKDKKDKKENDGVKTPLYLAKSDNIEGDIDSIFKTLEEFKPVLNNNDRDILNKALNDVISENIRDKKEIGKMEISDSTSKKLGDITLNGKKIMYIDEIINNIKKIREKYKDIKGDNDSLLNIINIINNNVNPKYVINEGLKLFVYSNLLINFTKEIKTKEEELDKYMKYTEEKFDDSQQFSVRVKFGLRKRLVDAGLELLLQVIIMVTYREYNKSILPSYKKILATGALPIPGLTPGVFLTLGVAKGLEDGTRLLLGKLNMVSDGNIKKLLYSLETNKRLKDEILYVNKELESKLMEFIKQLKKEDDDEKVRKDENKKRKEADKKNRKEDKLKKQEEEKKKNLEEKKRKSEEKKRKSEEKKRKKQENKKNKSPDKTSTSSKGVSNDNGSNKQSADKQASDKGRVKQSADNQSADNQSADKQSGDKQSGNKQSTDKESADKQTKGDKNKQSGERTDKKGDKLEVFKDSSVLELDPSDKAIDLTEKDYIPNSDTQSVLSLKNRDNKNLKDRLREESRSNTIKLTKLKKQLKELMDFKDEEKETEKHKKEERFKLIQDLNKAINQNYSEKKRIEEQHRITELQLLQDKKSLQTDFELLTKENLKLKHELQVSRDKKALESETINTNKQRKGRKGKSTRKKKRKKSKINS